MIWFLSAVEREIHLEASPVSFRSVCRPKTFLSLGFIIIFQNGETETPTCMRPRGSPSSQLRHGVSFRSREMPPLLAISQRMRPLKGLIFVPLSLPIQSFCNLHLLNRISVSWIVVNCFRTVFFISLIDKL